jgi:hypothetical protein
MYEVERYGMTLYHDPKPEEEIIRKLVELAEEYYRYSVRCVQQLMYRATIDLGQNAIELILKALILVKKDSA